MSIDDYQYANLPEDKMRLLRTRQLKNITGLVSEEEAAGCFDVEPSTLATWRSQGKGPEFVKLGKTCFYTTNTIIAWVQSEATRQAEARKAATA